MGVRFVACRVCGAANLLNPALIREGEGLLRCTQCARPFRVRRTDVDRFPRRMVLAEATRHPGAADRLRPDHDRERAAAAGPGDVTSSVAVAPVVARPGWYPNPDGTRSLRYFDGARWTSHVGTRPSVLPRSSDQVGPSAPPHSSDQPRLAPAAPVPRANASVPRASVARRAVAALTAAVALVVLIALAFAGTGKKGGPSSGVPTGPTTTPSLPAVRATPARPAPPRQHGTTDLRDTLALTP